MNSRFFVGFFAGSLSAGFSYWLFEVFSYLMGSVRQGIIPFDALFMLLVSLAFAVIFCGAICLPILIYLQKKDALGLIPITLLSALIAASIINIFHQSYPWERPSAAVIGIIGGLVFYWVSGLSGRKKEQAASGLG